MPFKRKIASPQAPKRSTRKSGTGRQKVRADDAVTARKVRSAAR